MPTDGQDGANKTESEKINSTAVHEQQQRSWFTVPAPVKRVFDTFPLVTYDENDLPLRAPRLRNEHVLYVFASAEDARLGRPSFNPGCLKWQTYLKSSGLHFRIVPSNNHASPSGSLPFLIPAASGSSTLDGNEVVASNKLQAWAVRHAKASEESPDVRYEAFMSLVDHSIRRAWLLNVYLTANFESIVVPCYIHQFTTSSFVRLASAYELQTAARNELQKLGPIIDSSATYTDAQDAFAALDTLLGEDSWFFGQAEPGLFDAAVFAYTYLLLEDGHDRVWKDTTLQDLLRRFPGLVRHQHQVHERYYSK